MKGLSHISTTNVLLFSNVRITLKDKQNVFINIFICIFMVKNVVSIKDICRSSTSSICKCGLCPLKMAVSTPLGSGDSLL